MAKARIIINKEKLPGSLTIVGLLLVLEGRGRTNNFVESERKKTEYPAYFILVIKP